MNNGTLFVNPSHPLNDTKVSNCELTVALVKNNICQLRLDFISFELEQPNRNGKCETDFMTVTGTANDDSIPILCGNNTGKHSKCPRQRYTNALSRIITVRNKFIEC